MRWLSYIEPSDCKIGQPMPYWRSAAPPTRSSAKSCASATSMESRSKVPSAEAVQRLTPFSRSWPWAVTTVVVGVRPRSGEALSFLVAAELLDKAPCSLLMVASEPFVEPADRRLRTEKLTT